MGAKHTQGSFQNQNGQNEPIHMQVHHPYFTQSQIIYRYPNSNGNTFNNQSSSNKKTTEKHDSSIKKLSSSFSLSASNSNSAYIKNTKVTDAKYYKEWKDALSKYQLDNQFLLLPLHEKFSQHGLCSTQGQLQTQYQNFSHLLSDEIEERKISKKYFKQTQLWYLLYAYISSKNYLYMKQSQQTLTKNGGIFGILGDIRPHNVFIDQNHQVKFSNLYSWPNEKTNYQKTFSGVKTYLAPEDIQKLKLGVKQRTDKKLNQSSQMFSIGLTLMSVATLNDFLDLYDIVSFKLNTQYFIKFFNQFRSSKQYSPLIKEIILNLCQLDYKNRSNCRELYSWLSKYQRRLIQKKPLKFQEIPQRINELMNNKPQNQLIKIISSEPSSLQSQSKSYSFRGNSDMRSPNSKVVFNYQPKVTQLKFQYKSPSKIVANKQQQKYTSIIYAPINKSAKPVVTQKPIVQKTEKYTPISKVSIEEHLPIQSKKNTPIESYNFQQMKNIQKIFLASIKLIEPVTHFSQDPDKKKILKQVINFDIPQIIDTILENNVKKPSNSEKPHLNENHKHDTKYFTIQNLILKPTLKAYAPKNNSFIQEQLKAQINERKRLSLKLQDEDFIKSFINLGKQQNIRSSQDKPTQQVKDQTKPQIKDNLEFMIFQSPYQQNMNNFPQVLHGGKNQLSDYFEKIRQLKPKAKQVKKKQNKMQENLIINESQRIHNEKTDKILKTLFNNEVQDKDINSNGKLSPNQNTVKLYNPIESIREQEESHYYETQCQIPLYSTGPHKKHQSQQIIQTEHQTKQQKKGFLEILLSGAANKKIS